MFAGDEKASKDKRIKAEESSWKRREDKLADEKLKTIK